MTRWVRNGGKRRAWPIRRRILTFAGIAVLLMAACHKAGESAPPVITIEDEVTPQPARVGTATITLRLADPSGKAVTGARVALEGSMTHAGMGPVFGEAKEIDPGRYQTSLELSMGGDWIVLIHLTLSDGQKLERQFEIRGVLSD
jgi:YtkA-like